MEKQPSQVLPNSKCNQCFNYERESGPVGTCIVGMQPMNCGDGSTPYVGYTPVTSLSPHIPEGNAPTAHAVTGADTENAIVIVEQVLGEEAHQLIKSMAQRAEGLIKEACPKCRLQKSSGYGSRDATLQNQPKCACVSVKADVIAKAVHAALPTHKRMRIDDEALAVFAKAVLVSDMTTGEVIGQTRSGKDVTAPRMDEMAKSMLGVSRLNYTAQEHFDAAQLHAKAARQHYLLGHPQSAAAHARTARLHSEEYSRRA